MVKLGIGKACVGKRLGKETAYSDVVYVAKDNTWIINQRTSMNNSKEDRGAELKRKIGKNLAMFNLPKELCGPIIETMEKVLPRIANDLSATSRYY
ncbi:hypothetical protein LY76DRAFT_651503 [Colletotrichum caudatum]|nr:hypothetical protein LY76DRAFT_651503 [Colletotrichum caudatum]